MTINHDNTVLGMDRALREANARIAELEYRLQARCAVCLGPALAEEDLVGVAWLCRHCGPGAPQEILEELHRKAVELQVTLGPTVDVQLLEGKLPDRYRLFAIAAAQAAADFTTWRAEHGLPPREPA